MAAREIAVATLATVYAVSIETDVSGLGANLAASWSLPVALAYLAWFVYAPQCVSTIAVVRRETNSISSTGFCGLFICPCLWRRTAYLSSGPAISINPCI